MGIGDMKIEGGKAVTTREMGRLIVEKIASEE